MVYVKPDNSCQGKGIIRVSRSDKGIITVISNDYGRKLSTRRFTDLWNMIQKLRMRRPYIIQQGINSLTKKKQLFDFRVHLVRSKKKWRIVGIAGRVASKHLIVTNYYHGVEYKPVKNLLKRDLQYSNQRAKKTVQKIRQVSRRATSRISKSYARWNEFGIDLGIDRKGRIWIYEINISPSALVFQKFNPKLYRKIMENRR